MKKPMTKTEFAKLSRKELFTLGRKLGCESANDPKCPTKILFEILYEAMFPE